jgi:hypothetical protein
VDLDVTQFAKTMRSKQNDGKNGLAQLNREEEVIVDVKNVTYRPLSEFQSKILSSLPEVFTQFLEDKLGVVRQNYYH